jgi:hypothetical protein
MPGCVQNIVTHCADPAALPDLLHEKFSEDDWDRRGREMLEALVMAEFARKLAAQYLLKKQVIV